MLTADPSLFKIEKSDNTQIQTNSSPHIFIFNKTSKIRKV